MTPPWPVATIGLNPIGREGASQVVSVSPDGGWTAEEFYADVLARTHVFEARSKEYARARDAVGAVVSQLGADMSTVQSAAWERIVVVSQSPQAPLFDIGARVLQGLSVEALESGAGHATARSLVESSRSLMLSGVDLDLRGELESRLASLDHLSEIPAPTGSEFRDAASGRLGGLAPDKFVEARRVAAREHMAAALRLRQEGSIAAAIEAAYEADMLTLDAYLVESATAIGDDLLVTV